MSRVRENPGDRARCDEDGCERVQYGKGLCRMHYKRMRRATGTWKPAPSDAWDAPKRMARYKARKALRRGATQASARVVVGDLIERDGRECGICGDDMTDVAYPHPLSASIDHIQPISLGGQHTLDNLRATHLRCNIRRGNRENIAA